MREFGCVSLQGLESKRGEGRCATVSAPKDSAWSASVDYCALQSIEQQIPGCRMRITLRVFVPVSVRVCA